MFFRLIHIVLVLLAVAGYAADVVACYEERAETHCTTEHGNTPDGASQQDCHDCVCHMLAEVSPESTGTVLLFDKVENITKQHTPVYYLVTPPDLQPPRLS